jgi:hypothetical protein
MSDALDAVVARDNATPDDMAALNAILARDGGAPLGAAPAAAPVQAPPQSDGFGTLSDFGSALLHNTVKPLHGLVQFVENGVAKGASLLPNNPVSRGIVSTAAADNAAQQAWEKQYQQGTPDNAASYTGAVIGTVAPMLLSGAARGLQAVGDAAGGAVQAGGNAIGSAVRSMFPSVSQNVVPAVIPKIVSGATQGAIMGAASPVDSGQPYWDSKGGQVASGAAFGAALPAVGAAARGVWNAAAPIVNPSSIVRNGLARWGVTPDALANAPQLVTGSLPTTAQIAANPDIVAAEKALANNPLYKPLFDARNNANNDARWAAINSVAQTPDALTAAVQARRAATGPMQAALLDNGNPVPVAPIISQLTDLAKGPLGTRPTIGAAANDILGQIKDASTTDAQGNVTIPSAHLDAIRQNVKDYLAQHAPNGVVGSQEEAAFEPIRGSIVDAIDGANPGYRDYLAKYAQLSVPINTMQAGAAIVDNLSHRGANSAGAPGLQLTGFNSQLKQALNRPYGISPDAEASLRGIQDDLQRASISNSVKSGSGSDTAYNLQAPGALASALYGNNFQGGKLLPVLGGLVGGVAGVKTGGGFGLLTGAGAGAGAGKMVSNLAARRVNGLLANALLNPQVASEIAAQPTASYLSQGLLGRIPQAALLMGGQRAIAN